MRTVLQRQELHYAKMACREPTWGSVVLRGAVIKTPSWRQQHDQQRETKIKVHVFWRGITQTFR